MYCGKRHFTHRKQLNKYFLVGADEKSLFPIITQRPLKNAKLFCFITSGFVLQWNHGLMLQKIYGNNVTKRNLRFFILSYRIVVGFTNQQMAMTIQGRQAERQVV